ncbi:pre-mRNA-splicing factor SYF1-like, partial [Corapipo altera]|uniref:pre-mRNA-splicing factor SYF1-like n=1 Tax=Corapipo altera TaxID=415028 RepID=UPI000FD643F5
MPRIWLDYCQFLAEQGWIMWTPLCPPDPPVPPQMPRIWLDYCQFLAEQGRITRTRRTFDRALRALPITQHRRLWPPYLSFVRKHPLPETAVRVFRRFLKLCPEEAEQYVSYLRSVGGF